MTSAGSLAATVANGADHAHRRRAPCRPERRAPAPSHRRDRRPREDARPEPDAAAVRGLRPGPVRPRDGAGVRPVVGVAGRHRGPPRARRLPDQPDRRAARPGDPPGGRLGARLPEQLPPPGVGAGVRRRRPLRAPAHLPVPQLGLRDRRPPRRHPRQGPHVPRRLADGGLRAGADPRRGRLGQARVRVPVAADAPRSASGSPPSPTATTATTSGRSVATTPSSTRRTRSTGRPSSRTRTTTTTCASCTDASTPRASRSTRIVRFGGRTASGYKPHRLDVDDPGGGRDRPPRGGAQRPLRRLRLPEPHAAAVPDAADPRARRSDRPRPHAPVLADLRRRQDHRAGARRARVARHDEPRGHRHGQRPHAEPALAVLPGGTADDLGGPGRPHDAAGARGRGDPARARRVRRVR